jgi:hypothetical protein
MSLWENATIWAKVKDTINISGAIFQGFLIAANSEHVWNYLTLGIQLIGAFITIWGEDKDKDGRVDIFQKEVTIKMPADTKVEITEEVKPKDQ